MNSSLSIWVSIKIKTADSSGGNDNKILALRALRKEGTPRYIVNLLDEFTRIGPNGEHKCLVFEFLGPTSGGERLEPETILKLTKQMLQAVKSVHESGYVHGGQSLSLSFPFTRTS